MNSNDEKNSFITVENFMADVPDSATREELYDLLGDDPMFSPENLAKAQESIDQLMKGDDTVTHVENDFTYNEQANSPTLSHSNVTDQVTNTKNIRLFKWFATICAVAAVICFSIVIWQQVEIGRKNKILAKHTAIDQAMQLVDEANALIPGDLLNGHFPQDIVVKNKAALHLLAEVGATEHPVYRHALTNLQLAYETLPDSDDKLLGVLRELRTVDLKRYGEQGEMYHLQSLISLAFYEARHNNRDAAIAVLNEYAQISEQRNSRKSPEYIRALESFANLYKKFGDYQNVAQTYQTMIDLEQRKYLVADYHFSLADAYLHLGEDDRRIEHLERGIAIQRESEHPPSIFHLRLLADEYRLKLRMEKADALLVEAMNTTWREPSNDAYPIVLMELAHIRSLEGKDQDAYTYITQAINLFELRKETQKADYITALRRAALISSFLGGNEQADKLYKQAVAAYESAKDLHARMRVDLLVTKSVIENSKRQYDEALKTAKEAAQVSQKEVPEDHATIIHAQMNLAILFTLRNETDSAEAAIKVVKANLSKMKTVSRSSKSLTLLLDGMVNAQQGKFEKAADHLKEAIAFYPEQTPFKTLLQNTLVAVYKDWNHIDDARMLAMTIKEPLDKLIPPEVQQANKGKVIMVKGFPVKIPNL